MLQKRYNSVKRTEYTPDVLKLNEKEIGQRLDKGSHKSLYTQYLTIKQAKFNSLKKEYPDLFMPDQLITK